MKIISTAVLLGITLLAVPILTYFFGTPPGVVEWNAINTLLIIMALSIAYSFFVGELTNNNSQVDKLWSILPVIYVWVVACYGNYSPRLLMIAALVTLWGLRLTINFAMKVAVQANTLNILIIKKEFRDFYHLASNKILCIIPCPICQKKFSISLQG
jgi:steroid 5-alpha reductase family enzyme